jgi:hypothetical protein
MNLIALVTDAPSPGSVPPQTACTPPRATATVVLLHSQVTNNPRRRTK